MHMFTVTRKYTKTRFDLVGRCHRMFYQYQQVCSTFVGIPDTDANFYPDRADISLSAPHFEVEIYDRDCKKKKKVHSVCNESTKLLRHYMKLR